MCRQNPHCCNRNGIIISSCKYCTNFNCIGNISNSYAVFYIKQLVWKKSSYSDVLDWSDSMTVTFLWLSHSLGLFQFAGHYIHKTCIKNKKDISRVMPEYIKRFLELVFNWPLFNQSKVPYEKLNCSIFGLFCFVLIIQPLQNPES